MTVRMQYYLGMVCFLGTFGSIYLLARGGPWWSIPVGLCYAALGFFIGKVEAR